MVRCRSHHRGGDSADRLSNPAVAATPEHEQNLTWYSNASRRSVCSGVSLLPSAGSGEQPLAQMAPPRLPCTKPAPQCTVWQSVGEHREGGSGNRGRDAATTALTGTGCPADVRQRRPVKLDTQRLCGEHRHPQRPHTPRPGSNDAGGTGGRSNAAGRRDWVS